MRERKWQTAPFTGGSWETELGNQLSDATRLLRSESLAEKTTLRVGGKAGFFAEPASVDDLQTLLRAAAEACMPVFFLGRGSNLIVPDEGFPGLVVRLHHPFWREIRPLREGRFHVGAGARLKQICGETCRLGFSGFEFLEGIPGTLGGSLRMNAGAMGGWIFDVVEEVEYLSLDGKRHIRHHDEFHVEYRKCRELCDAIAISAVLRSADKQATDTIRNRIQGFARKRRSVDPVRRN